MSKIKSIDAIDDDPIALDLGKAGRALMDSYLVLLVLRPPLLASEFPRWHRTVRTLEDLLAIHPTERHTRPAL